ncbi:MAG: sedoheptulose 7-phosphate cyclase [Pseudomonadota bacterium]
MSYIEIIDGKVSGNERSIQLNAVADYSYNIDIVNDLFGLDNSVFAQKIGGRPSLIVLSPSISQLYGHRIERYLSHHLPPEKFAIITCPSGEHNKVLETAVGICEKAKDCRLDRDGLFIGIGGGIVLDLVGFAASMYRRGTKFIKVATTLVGQVDVAVGVKTGVNALRSKNFLGSYYPAFATFNDPQFLKTLPEREMRCGMAEVIKMGLSCDSVLFEQIDKGLGLGPQGDLKSLNYDIYALAMLRMAEELQPNLLEAELERVVDFGHTFSMRFEIESDHRILHGEAVAIDMALSCCIARLLGRMSVADCDRALRQIQRSGLSVWDDEVCHVDNLLASIDEVQLHRQAVNLVLPSAIGQSFFIKQKSELGQGVLSEALDMLSRYAVQKNVLEGVE